VIATYASAALICGASLVVGRAVMCLLGRGERSWLEPAVGLAVLLVACSTAIRLPGHIVTAIVVFVLLLAAALLYLRGRAWGPEAARIALPAALLALLLASIPFIASGHIGIPGVGVNNDMGGHLIYADWLEDRQGPAPRGVDIGYPVGPHGLAATVSEVIGSEPLRGLLGLLLAIPVLTAVTSTAILWTYSPVARAVGGALVALPYMAASTLGISGFKELIAGLFLLGFVLALRALSRGERGRLAFVVSLGTFAAGTVAAYSYPGIAWVGAAGAIWAAAEIARALIVDPDRARAGLRAAAPYALGALAILAALAVAELPRILEFRESGAVQFIEGVEGKLRFAVSAIAALGTWPSGEFLLGTGDVSNYWIFAVIGLAGLGFGLAWWLREGDLALPAGIAAAVFVYLLTLWRGEVYVQAKALAVPASLIMLVVAGALLAPGLLPSRSVRGERAAGRPPPGERTRWLRLGLAVVVLGVAAYSSFLALRDAVIAPETRFQELSDLRARVEGKRVLALTSDRFTDYGLSGAEVLSPARNAEAKVNERPGKNQRLPVDFDSVRTSTLNKFNYALTTRSGYQSAAPPNFNLIAETPSYYLWKRNGATPPIEVLAEEARPGRIFRCQRPKFASLLFRAPEAGAVIWTPRPEIAKRLYWRPDKAIEPGDSASQEINLPPGDWDLSMQYASPVVGIDVLVGDLEVQLPAGVEGTIPYRATEGPFWPVGQVHSEGGPIEVRVAARELSTLQKLLGVDAPANLGNLTAVRADGTLGQSLGQSCKLYVDHYFSTEAPLTQAQLQEAGIQPPQ
jgi:hypothetical protein